MRRIISKVVETLFGRRGGAKAGAVPKPARPQEPAGPVIVKREEHTLSRSRIDEDALKVLNRLARNNHTAYLVGGGVRDLLLDRPVKDFDIATSAHPQEIKTLFRNCRLIGRRFRLAHILFRGGKVIEVSTFRKQTGFSDEGDLLIKSDNTFGTPQEDALRRDFTINGLFYSITDFSVIDYVDGLTDLKRGVIRTIGDPNIRLREDPIRSLRAIRIAARLGFAIDPGTREAMTAHRDEIWKSAAPRIVDEFVRMLNQGAAATSFPLLAELGMLGGLLPGFAKAYADPQTRARIQRNLASLDAHQKPQGGLPPGLALAVLYHPLFEAACAAAGPDADHAKTAAELLDAEFERLKFPRTQLEKAVLLLAAQQRLTQPPQRRRGRGGAIAARPWFAEALTLFEITQAGTPEGHALLRRLRALQHRTAAEARPHGGPAGHAAGGTEEQVETGEGAVEGETAPEEGVAAAPRRRRRSRRGRGKGRTRQAAEVAPGETDREPAPAAGARRVAAAPAAEPRVPAPGHGGTRHTAAPPPARLGDEDRPIDPDAAFGDSDTDLEPPGAPESPEDRTD